MYDSLSKTFTQTLLQHTSYFVEYTNHSGSQKLLPELVPILVNQLTKKEKKNSRGFQHIFCGVCVCVCVCV